MFEPGSPDKTDKRMYKFEHGSQQVWIENSTTVLTGRVDEAYTTWPTSLTSRLKPPLP